MRFRHVLTRCGTIALAVIFGSVPAIPVIGSGSAIPVIGAGGAPNAAASAQPAESGSMMLVPVGDLAAGPTSAVAVSGTLALVGISDTLTLVDIANPAVPSILGQAPLNTPFYRFSPTVSSVAVSGTTAYLTTAVIIGTSPNTAGALTIIDVADPAHPAILGALNGPARGDVAVAGHYAYDTASFWGRSILQITDIATPQAPTFITATAEANGSGAIAIAGDRAYLTRSVLEIWAIGDPHHPQVTSVFTPTDQPADIAVRDGLAYLLEYGGLEIVDVHDPAQPQRLGGVALPEAFGRIALGEDTAFAALGDDGLVAIDVRDPAAPSIRAHARDADVEDVAVAGDLLVVARDARGLAILRMVPATQRIALPLIAR